MRKKRPTRNWRAPVWPWPTCSRPWQGAGRWNWGNGPSTPPVTCQFNRPRRRNDRAPERRPLLGRGRFGDKALGRVGLEIGLVREMLLHARDVERAFPFRDHDRRDTVADEVGQRARLRHEAVDAEDDGDAGDRDRAD